MDFVTSISSMSRNFHISLSTPIAIGFTAEIFAWKNGLVLKLFNRGIARSTVEYEANLTRLVHATGLPIPAEGEILEFDDRFGLEYERVDGISMLQAMMQQPWKFGAFAHQLAELQARLHKIKLPELPSLKEKLERKIRGAVMLPENIRQAALQALERLPDEDWLCHGDFHPNNILLTSSGPVIIDWIDAARGSPILDMARSTLLIGGGPLPPGTPRVVKLLRGWFYQTYLQRYSQLIPIDRIQLAHWIPVVVAARLDENIHMDEKRLLSLAHRLIQ